MSLKCQKYLNKLANTDVNDSKFGLYLTKLNYWYEQVGGGFVDGAKCAANKGRWVMNCKGDYKKCCRLV